MTHLVYLVLLCFVVYREKKNIAHAFYQFKKENLKFRQMVSNGILVKHLLGMDKISFIRISLLNHKK